MFEQFRSHFPRGSLISELVQIDHGKYIVRASVQNEGLTLATGLAAADTVEKAEDQARLRALAVLDISLTPVEQPQPPASAPRKTATKSPRPEKTSSESVTHTSSNNVATVESEESAKSPQKTAIAPPLPPPTSGGSEGGSPSPPKTEKTSASSPSDEQETVMDSSDIIARTNVELRRLNWTSEQGRKFLQETYGKRSRSLLSDSELLEFLEYLEKQPTPPSE